LKKAKFFDLKIVIIKSCYMKKLYSAKVMHCN